MNLSDFNRDIEADVNTGEKRQRFDNGSIFEFYTLNNDRMIKISKAMSKLDENADDVEVAYTLLPYICSINVDVSLEKFQEMSEVSPCTEFTTFLILLTEYIRDLLKQVEKMQEMNNKTNKLVEDYPMLKKQETVEEKITRLTKEMNKEENIKKKREMLLELAKLYEEVEKGE